MIPAMIIAASTVAIVAIAAVIIVALLALLPAALHLGWQVATLDSTDGAGALARFRSNRTAGLLVALACWVVGNAGIQ